MALLNLKCPPFPSVEYTHLAVMECIGIASECEPVDTTTLQHLLYTTFVFLGTGKGQRPWETKQRQDPTFEVEKQKDGIVLSNEGVERPQDKCACDTMLCERAE